MICAVLHSKYIKCEIDTKDSVGLYVLVEYISNAILSE